MISLIALTAMILFVLILQRYKVNPVLIKKVKDKLMFSSILRSQIQTYFATSLAIIAALKLQEDMLMPIIKLLILVILPFFSWFYLRKNQAAAETDEFKVRFGTLF